MMPFYSFNFIATVVSLMTPATVLMSGTTADQIHRLRHPAPANWRMVARCPRSGGVRAIALAYHQPCVKYTIPSQVNQVASSGGILPASTPGLASPSFVAASSQEAGAPTPLTYPQACHSTGHTGRAIIDGKSSDRVHWPAGRAGLPAL